LGLSGIAAAEGEETAARDQVHASVFLFLSLFSATLKFAFGLFMRFFAQVTWW